MIINILFPLCSLLVMAAPGPHAEILKKPALNLTAISEIRAGQLAVGHEYAFFKALQDAGLDPKSDWKKLNTQDQQKLISSVKKELSSGVPVFRTPDNTLHAIDQHHDMFVLVALLGTAPQVQVGVEIIEDFSKKSMSHNEFKKMIQSKGWVYEKHLDQILDHPVAIKDLANAPERSATGMAFLHFENNENIPLKGKYFVPFIQFLLADFLTDTQGVVFSSTYNPDDVDKVVELIHNSQEVKEFLKNRLITKAPKELKDFLNE